uniref:Transposase n=1 Tax=Echinostoma caproni TaxID=27848 RepID=A0A183A2T2_9TREM
LEDDDFRSHNTTNARTRLCFVEVSEKVDADHGLRKVGGDKYPKKRIPVCRSVTKNRRLGRGEPDTVVAWAGRLIGFP